MMNAIGAVGIPIEVLLVEDSPADVRLMEEAFRDVNKAIRLHFASDGVEAMAFLSREGIHAQAPRPDLILLDLNLPRMNGHEVLKHIKSDARWQHIPTIILSTSDAEADVMMAYQNRANCYLRKSADFDMFQRMVKGINDFWLSKVTLLQRRLIAPARGL
jgi:two-component system, chemotaxis family, response regulator Rcp1